MNKEMMTDTIISAKVKQELTWEAIAGSIGLSPVFTTSVCLGMNSMPGEAADKLCEVMSLPEEFSTALQAFPHKSWDQLVPTDPVIYRLYEVVGVYGTTLKELIHEKFGDGIMSAIDFSMHVDKQEDPRGDRVILTLNGKFLPYRSW